MSSSIWSCLKYSLLILPELGALFIVAAAYVFEPGWFAVVAKSVLLDNSFLQYLPTIPFALIIGSVKLGHDTLLPSTEQQNKILFAWPMYWMLKGLVFSSNCLCAICFAAILAFYVGHPYWSLALSGAILSSALIVSTINVFTLLMARIEIKRILALYA